MRTQVLPQIALENKRAATLTSNQNMHIKSLRDLINLYPWALCECSCLRLRPLSLSGLWVIHWPTGSVHVWSVYSASGGRGLKEPQDYGHHLVVKRVNKHTDSWQYWHKKTLHSTQDHFINDSQSQSSVNFRITCSLWSKTEPNWPSVQKRMKMTRQSAKDRRRRGSALYLKF